ncbi:16S rRNA (cytosine(1402)-N(4))-methyltransferase, partial [Akkermansiaceae bacterium]|nr:16S rRNA (cytosine(1402)-N(4))-methyltransferase [Akkermansiaceae bacterium]
MLTASLVKTSPNFGWLNDVSIGSLFGRREMGAAYAAVEPASESPEQPFYHESILLEEVVQFLQPVAGKLMADGTLGGGGHTEALLKAGATVKGIDRDADA